MFVTLLVLGLLICVGSVTFASDRGKENASATDEGLAVESNESSETKADENSVSMPTLKPVVVVGTVDRDASGKTELLSEQLSEIPSRNGSLNETLTIAPGVQYSDSANDSFTAGEIRPPNISISGGRTYQNDFQIDGFSNNSLLDPDEESTNSAIVIQGHPQELFVNPRMIESVSVYDSNIPAEYGSFTGGVVDAHLIRPKETFSGHLFYRTTRDDWTNFYVDPAAQSDFENSNSESSQPRFSKHDFGTLLNLPVTEKSGLVLSYQQLRSTIPLLHFGQAKSQQRRSDNIFAKYGVRPDSRNYGELSLLYTPYSGAYFRKNTVNSDYTVHGGGLLIGGVWERQFDVGFLELRAGYRRSKNSREAPTNLFGWAVTPAKPWGALVGSTRSDEGMLGDLKLTQETWQLKSDLTSRPLDAGSVIHQFKTGIDYENIHGKYHRPTTSYWFSTAVEDSSVQCRADDFACIISEQYLNRRYTYEAASVTASVNLVSLYFQDTIDWKRLQIRLGLRTSYDDFMERLNVAPRLTSVYDLFGNGKTRLVAGWNRYYGKSVLTYKLREAISPTNKYSTRGLIEDPLGSGVYFADNWGPNSSGSAIYRDTKVKTPYKDEITAWLEQQIAGGLFEFRYIHREGRDEFAREYERILTGLNQYRLTNNGRSSYDAYMVNWTRYWETQYLNVNVTYQESTTGNESYMKSLSDIQLERKIWYDGELIPWDERPREDFSRPWVANLTYTLHAGKNFSFTNVTKYRGPYFSLKDSKVNSPIDGNDIYERVRQSSSTIFDWVLAWTIPVFNSAQHLVLTAEVYNVFNKKAPLGDAVDKYELGRQFWAGVEYKF